MSQKVAILIHGIGLKDKDENKGLGLYRDALEAGGWATFFLDMGRYFFLRVWLANSVVARILAIVTSFFHDRFGFEFALIGHSNGAAIATEASRRGAPLVALVFISGAVDRTPKIGEHTTYVVNYFNKFDPILELARVFQFDPDWGDAGEEKAVSSAVTNIPLANWGVSTHNGALQPRIAPYIAEHLATQLNGIHDLYQT